MKIYIYLSIFLFHKNEILFYYGFWGCHLNFCSFSLGDIFPPLSLNFMGGASMFLKPEQYLMHYGFLVSVSFSLFDCSLLLAWVGVFLLNCIPLIIVYWLLCFFAGWCCNVVHWFPESAGGVLNFRRLEAGKKCKEFDKNNLFLSFDYDMGSLLVSFLLSLEQHGAINKSPRAHQSGISWRAFGVVNISSVCSKQHCIETPFTVSSW